VLIVRIPKTLRAIAMVVNIILLVHSVRIYFCVFIVTLTRQHMCAVSLSPDKVNSRRNLGRNGPTPSSPPPPQSEPIHILYLSATFSSVSSIRTAPINDRNSPRPIRIGPFTAVHRSVYYARLDVLTAAGRVAI